MPFATSLSSTPSPSVIPLPRRLDRHGLAHSRHAAQELRSSARPAAAQPPKIVTVASTTSQMMLETSAGLAQSAGLGLLQTVLAILSFVMAEALAGFAAYALAMYPTSEAMEEAGPHAPSQLRLPIPLASRLRESHARGLAMAELYHFDDCSLRDIEMSRGEIKVIAVHGDERG
jgi:hypothetical protein